MTITDVYILGIITGGILIYWVFRKLDSLRRSKIFKRAKKAEKEAIKLLKKEGYEIQAIQQSAEVYTEVDGKSNKNTVTVDYIVKKNGKTYLVEVKTGKQTARITASRIRRQLLEYFLIFRPHGIILLDMENRKLKQVFFRTANLQLAVKDKLDNILYYIIVLVLGIVLGLTYSLVR